MNERLFAEVARQPYHHLFVTVSGAHLYGFPSPDSDYDLRGAHILPVRDVIDLDPGRETIEVSEINGGMEIDLVTHDVKKFFSLLIKKNGYVLEQVFSPLVVLSSPEHVELKEIAPGCITRHHIHHYLGFADREWKLFEKETPPRIKPLLYLYRVLLTGIHMMQTGEVQANLVTLNERFRLPYIADLVGMKLNGAERSTIRDINVEFHRSEYARLRTWLEESSGKSGLPAETNSRSALNDLLVRIRLAAR